MKELRKLVYRWLHPETSFAYRHPEISRLLWRLCGRCYHFRKHEWVRSYRHRVCLRCQRKDWL